MEQSLNTMCSGFDGIGTIKQLHIPFFNGPVPDDEVHISTIMDQLPRQQILNTSWPGYQTTCKAEFNIMYTNDTLLLKYYIVNDYFRSKEREINGPVHFDNCVEFFVRFNNEPGYYNIEFNCLGIGKVAYGNLNKGRKFLSPKSVQRIKTIDRLNHSTNAFNWEMTLLIPFAIFQYSSIVLNNKLQCAGNFYKCGDHLPQPHFLTWNRIDAEAPNFHQPDFFGKLIFDNYAEKALSANRENFFDKKCVR